MSNQTYADDIRAVLKDFMLPKGQIDKIIKKDVIESEVNVQARLALMKVRQDPAAFINALATKLGGHWDGSVWNLGHYGLTGPARATVEDLGAIRKNADSLDVTKALTNLLRAIKAAEQRR